MRGEVFNIDAYWKARPETPRDGAERLAHMLCGLAGIHPAFSSWYNAVSSPTEIPTRFCEMPPDVRELDRILEGHIARSDRTGEPAPEYGYSIATWNADISAHGVMLTVHAAWRGDFPVFPNTVSIDLRKREPANEDLINARILRAALVNVVAAWEPDFASVWSWSYWERLLGPGGRGLPTFRSGWMTYLAARYAQKITSPKGIIADELPGGGLLMVATEEQFTVDNPAHVAAADAIQAALAPIQS